MSGKEQRPDFVTGESVPESACLQHCAVFLELTQAPGVSWGTAQRALGSIHLSWPLLPHCSAALDLPFRLSADSSLLRCPLPALRASCREQGCPGLCTLELTICTSS